MCDLIEDDDRVFLAVRGGDPELIRSVLDSVRVRETERCDGDVAAAKRVVAQHAAAFLRIAVATGVPECVEVLLESGAPLEAAECPRFGSPLAVAPSEAMVRWLMARGWSLDAMTPIGWPVVRAAMEMGDADEPWRVVHALVTCGADIHAWPDLFPDAVVKLGHVSTLQHLVDAGADPCAVDTEGETVLHYAAREILDKHRFTDVTGTFRFLQTCGVDVNARSHTGVTALAMACAWASAQEVDALLAIGADAAIRVPRDRLLESYECAALPEACLPIEIARVSAVEPNEKLRAFECRARE